MKTQEANTGFNHVEWKIKRSWRKEIITSVKFRSLEFSFIQQWFPHYATCAYVITICAIKRHLMNFTVLKHRNEQLVKQSSSHLYYLKDLWEDSLLFNTFCVFFLKVLLTAGFERQVFSNFMVMLFLPSPCRRHVDIFHAYIFDVPSLINVSALSLMCAAGEDMSGSGSERKSRPPSRHDHQSRPFL